MRPNISLVESRDIYSYKPVLEGLIDDFGFIYYHAILCWCKIIHEERRVKKEEEKSWQVWQIIYNSNVIGICGLYSLKPELNEFWRGWFGIVPKERHNFFGYDVLDELKIRARKLGAKKLMSYVDVVGKKSPLNWYKFNGFNVICTVEEFLKNNNYAEESDFEKMNDVVISCNLN